jgi:hypothetical protein
VARAHAVEINLRAGGTTHPYLALLALTEGTYFPDRAEFFVGGTPRHYAATDHLETPGLRTLTPDDVLDVIDESGLGWDDETRTDLVFHMLSGVSIAGRLGVTAIGDSPEAATCCTGAPKRGSPTLRADQQLHVVSSDSILIALPRTIL